MSGSWGAFPMRLAAGPSGSARHLISKFPTKFRNIYGVDGHMGGIGSGRWGGKPTVGGGLSLDLNELLRAGSLKRNTTTAGILTWPDPRSGEQVASIGYRATLGPERGDLWLQWATASPSTGQKQEREQWVELRSTTQPFGGRRWWFACYNELVWKLYLPAGSSRFASRREHGLAYRAQRQSQRDRAVSRAWKARAAWRPSATSAALVSSRNGCVGRLSSAWWRRSRGPRPS